MTDTNQIPLNKLTAWDGNVRKTASEAGIEELAASISAHGLLQSLVVRKESRGRYAVIAGRRRYLALKALADAGKITDSTPVSCHIIADGADPAEISLAENVVREPMHPADEFEAFRHLIDNGTPVADVAARFGVTETVVAKRLRLGRVSPAILASYRLGALSLDQVQAFTVSDDHAAQEQVLESLTQWHGDPDDIRDALTQDEIPATDKRVRFVTLRAYEKAGGGIRKDLFCEGDRGIFVMDPVLLNSLAVKKLEKAAKAIRSEGWKWVEIQMDRDFEAGSKLQRRYPEAVPLPDDLAAELAVLEREADAFHELDDLDDEQQARFDVVTTRIDEINDRESVFSPEVIAIAGAIVSLGSNGEPDITRGYIRPEDLKAAKAQRADDPDGEDDAGPETSAVRPALSTGLTEELTAHKSAAISALLAATPDIALAAIVHTLAGDALYGYGVESCLRITSRSASLPKALQQASMCVGVDALARTRAVWAGKIPAAAEDFWRWCLAQERDTLLQLLAFAVATTVDVIQAKHGSAEIEHGNALANALDLDLAQWFTPTAANYFGRVSKEAILSALQEAKGVAPAPAWLKLKRSDLSALAEREIAGTGWLPRLLRFDSPDEDLEQAA
jgi:ParB family chromosome partitioning protein